MVKLRESAKFTKTTYTHKAKGNTLSPYRKCVSIIVDNEMFERIAQRAYENKVSFATQARDYLTRGLEQEAYTVVRQEKRAQSTK